MRFTLVKRVMLVIGVLGALCVGVSLGVEYLGRRFIVEAQRAQTSEVIIVLGAGVFSNGTPSDVLRDRLKVAKDLFLAGRAPKILCSGDHGEQTYDEVNTMRRWLLDEGIPPEAIFLDHAGFSTYESLARARDVFGFSTITLVTQDFHLPRATYLAHELGFSVEGVSASRQGYVRQEYFELREFFARMKAFFQIYGKAPEVVSGPSLAGISDGRMTWDEVE